MKTSHCIQMTKTWRINGRRSSFARTQKTTPSVETSTLRLANSSPSASRCALLAIVTMRKRSRIGSWTSTLSLCTTRFASTRQSSSLQPNRLNLILGSSQSALMFVKFTATKFNFSKLSYKTMKRPISKPGQNGSRRTCSTCKASLPDP